MDGFAGLEKGRQITLCQGITKKKVNNSNRKVFVMNGCASEAIGNTFIFSDSPLRLTDTIVK
jgi:hypothetical protein